MNYDQRMELLKNWFKSDMLVRFAMPKDLDPKTVAIDVIESINSNLPANADKNMMDHFCAGITRDVVRSARTRTLPSVKEFLDVTRKVAQSHGEPRTGPSPAAPSRYTIAAKNIRSGLPISDSFLKGESRKKLKEEEGITDLDLEPYDKYIHNTAHKQ